MIKGQLTTTDMEELCDRTLRDLAPQLGDDWEKLASFLGFSKCEICMFKRDNPFRTEEQVFAMLVKWRQLACCGDQMEKLCKELRHLGRRELADQLKTQKKECPVHSGEVKNYYCETCNYRICRYCTVMDHRDHRFADVNEAFQSFKQDLKEFSADTHDIEELKRRSDEISEAKKMFNDNIAQAVKDIDDKDAKVIAAVTAKVKAARNQKIDQIEVFQRDRNATFDKCQREVHEQLRQKQRVMDLAKGLAHKEADCAYLSLIPTMRSDLKCAQSQRPPTSTCKCSFLKFMPSLEPCDTDLGDLVPEDIWKLSTEFGRKGRGPGEFEAAKGIAATSLDEIAVTDWKNERVIIFTSKGIPKSSIPTKACDIAASTCGLAIADRHTVKVYDEDKKVVLDFPTLPESENFRATDVQLDSIAIKRNSNIIAGDVKQNVVTELDPDGSIVSTIPVTTTPDFLAAMNNDRIAVSSWEQGLVDVVDGNASTIFKIKPTIMGQPAKNCCGVCYDSSAGIYLAVSTGFFKGGHIHHYNSGGNFISCIARGLYNPMGITFTADGQQLAVADWHSVKIYHKV